MTKASAKRENKQRAAGVAAALTAEPYSAKTEGFETALVDLLANIRHLCDAKGLDLGECDHMAHQHYLAELEQALTGIEQ